MGSVFIAKAIYKAYNNYKSNSDWSSHDDRIYA